MLSPPPSSHFFLFYLNFFSFCISFNFFINHFLCCPPGVSLEKIEIDPVLQPKSAKKFWGKQKFVSVITDSASVKIWREYFEDGCKTKIKKYAGFHMTAFCQLDRSWATLSASPMSDQHRISLYNLNTISSRQVMRIESEWILGLIIGEAWSNAAGKPCNGLASYSKKGGFIKLLVSSCYQDKLWLHELLAQVQRGTWDVLNTTTLQTKLNKHLITARNYQHTDTVI